MQLPPQLWHQHEGECSIGLVRRSLLALLAVAAFPATASAAPVLVLGHDGRVRTKNDPFVTGPAITPAPATAAARPSSGTFPRSGVTGSTARLARDGTPPASSASAAKPPAKRKRPQRTVASELTRMLRSHAITQATYRADNASFNRALKTEKHLTATRRTELTAVTETLHQIAASGNLTASRLPALFLTLKRNVQWWTTGSLPASGQRIEFPGSPLRVGVLPRPGHPAPGARHFRQGRRDCSRRDHRTTDSSSGCSLR